MISLQDRIRALFDQVLYVQLSPDVLTIRDPRTKEAFSEPPELAIRGNGKKQIIAFGRAARGVAREPGIKVINPFTHPRTLISDFTSADQLLKQFIRQLLGRRLFTRAPRLVLHPLGEFEGGLTQVELRALKELGMSAGASQINIWEGPSLTDDQLISKSFPSSGRLLE